MAQNVKAFWAIFLFRITFPPLRLADPGPFALPDGLALLKLLFNAKLPTEMSSAKEFASSSCRTHPTNTLQHRQFSALRHTQAGSFPMKSG
jgi:hypothetical protein